AEERDASRLAEILIFAKRSAYRPIFRDDPVSFGEMQVLPLALDFRDRPETRRDIWVFEESFVKGLVRCKRLSGTKGAQYHIDDLYVDPFFQGEGVGGRLLEHCLEIARREAAGSVLWVLEKNERARRFYEHRGFAATGRRRRQEGTTEYLTEYVRPAASNSL
ncbi:MAG: GNAT family N-acetyltransferase, partial [Eubacteriales bacterium]|nr:GNAT family N-acetyltransferase [Eubacteriales bacterium]